MNKTLLFGFVLVFNFQQNMGGKYDKTGFRKLVKMSTNFHRLNKD